MLVLARKKGESIMIGDNIELVVVGVEGDQIKLGIHAPKEVQVFRKEIYSAIRAANREASANRNTLNMLNELHRKLKKNGE